MKLKDPFNGLKITEGNTMFHLAFFVSSFTIVSTDSHKSFWYTDKNSNGLEINELTSQGIVWLMRIVHLSVFFLKIFIRYLKRKGGACLISAKILYGLEIVIYQGSVLYILYHLLTINSIDLEKRHS